MDAHVALLAGGVARLNGHVEWRTPVIVSYAFASPAALAGLPYDPADAALRSAMRMAAAEVEEVAGVTFVEVADDADPMISVLFNRDMRGWSWASFPHASEAAPETSGKIAMNAGYGAYGPGSAGFQVMLHELGHAIGLKHPHDAAPNLPGALDNTLNTVMSYNWVGAPKAAYQPLDVAALRALYGPAGAHSGVALNFDEWRDTLFVQGTAMADTLLGLNTDNVMSGSWGDDRLIGRSGDDLFRGDAGADTLVGLQGFDSLYGGGHDDRLFGGDRGDKLSGNFGDDVLFGEAGHDFLRGGPGDDQLFASIGDDTLVGDWGNDQLDGKAGADRLDGGAGADIMSGGPGADVFVLRLNSGADRILDFSPAEGDRLNVTQFGFGRPAALARVDVAGDDLLFDLGAAVVRLIGAAGEGLTGADFIL